jgi:hypothetical protein
MNSFARSSPSSRAVGLGLLTALLAGAAPARSPEAVIRSWPKPAQTAAKALIEKYGAPQRVGDRELVWVDNGPWLRTVAHRDARAGADYLEQAIAYEAPAEAIAYLRSFSPRVAYDPASKELSARSQSEALNFLALNLADEIARGNRSVESARGFYEKTTALRSAGKSSPYTGGFLFESHPLLNRTYHP